MGSETIASRPSNVLEGQARNGRGGSPEPLLRLITGFSYPGRDPVASQKKKTGEEINLQLESHHERQ